MIRRRFSTGESEFNPDKYLTIEALEDGLQISHANGFEYKTTNNKWQRANQNELTTEINKGEFLYIRANWITSNHKPFKITRSCNLRGNCLSLLFENNADKQHNISQFPYAFSSLFSSCPIKEVVSDFLPATTLSTGCYYNMFHCCSILTTSPNLPATTLSTDCYYSMFSDTNVLPDCSNIDFTSNIVLASGGLSGLFKGTKVTDSDLNRILPKNSNGKYCLPATTLVKHCYNSMFRDCTILTTAPELPAATLADYCYYDMFRGCSNLNYIKMLATNISAKECLSDWVRDVASSGTFIKNNNATWDVTGINGVPSGWTVKFDGEEDEKIDNFVSIVKSGTKYTLILDYPCDVRLKVTLSPFALISVDVPAGSSSYVLGSSSQFPYIISVEPQSDSIYNYTW